MLQIGQAFIDGSRAFLSKDYLAKIARCIERLSEEDIWWRANEESNSIGNLLLHLAGNVRQWIISGIGGADDHRVRQQEFAERTIIPKSELLANLQATLMEADAVLAKVDPASLLEKRTIQGKEVSIMYAIYHVVEHFSMHTGQIILVTKLRTNRDLEFYGFSAGIPIPRW
ncbi:MAG: DinB family protein [Acidobacteriota bacterium]